MKINAGNISNDFRKCKKGFKNGIKFAKCFIIMIYKYLHKNYCEFKKLT